MIPRPPRRVVVTGDIFRMQPAGGITRIFAEVLPRLERPARVVLGFHRSRALRPLKGLTTWGLRTVDFPLAPRVRGVLNGAVDAMHFARLGRAILQPSYYRHPDSLPSGLPLVTLVYDMAHEALPALFQRSAWSAPDPARHKAALCARADRIVCISEATRRDLIELLRVDASRTRVVHCGTRDWRGVDARPLEGATRPFVLWVGERQGYKNFMPTVEAWHASRAARDTRLVAIGGGPWRKHEREAFDRLGVQQRIVRRDASDAQLRWAYQNAAALLYTARWEGFGLPMLEAMSLGCEVVASDLPALREVAGEAAHFASPTQREAISAALESALAVARTSTRRALLAERTRAFSWDRTAEGLENVYRELD